MKNKNNATENESSITDAESKIIDMTKRIKDLNEAISKKQSELQILYYEWRQARTLHSIGEISDEEVETKKIKCSALKEETENLISELDPLTSALKLLKERKEATLNKASIEHRESLTQRLNEIRETKTDELNSALDLMSEICTLETALYDPISTITAKGKERVFEDSIKKDYYKNQFRTAIDSLRFLIPSDFDLAECKRVLHL